MMKSSLFAVLSTFFFTACSKQETATSAAPSAESGDMAMASDAKPYPLETCLVSGEELGSMGEPISIVHEGQTIKFCCDMCVPKFSKDPEKYLGKLEN